jgi:hypothetical protein
MPPNNNAGVQNIVAETAADSPFIEEETCQAGYQTSCQHKEFISTAQAPMLRVPFADGMASPDVPSDDLIPPSLWRPPTSWAPAGSPPTRPT